MEGRSEQCGHEPGNTGRQHPPEAGRDEDVRALEGTSPADTAVLNLQPPDRETVDLSCLEPAGW